MKTTIYMALLAFVLVSCKKDDFTPDTPDQPVLTAKIFSSITEPREAVLGDSSSIFTPGEYIVIYVPYQMKNDELKTAMLNLTDDTGELLNSIDMISSTDMTVGEMNVPGQLQGSRFVYAVIELPEHYAGKMINIHAQISGKNTVSDDNMMNAFSVRF
jgi:hypothetical protein